MNIEKVVRELLTVIGVRPKTYITHEEALTDAMANRLNRYSNPVGAIQNLNLPRHQRETDGQEDDR